MSKIKHDFYVRVKNGKAKQIYTTLGRANEGAKYRGGEIYGVDIINDKPQIVSHCRGCFSDYYALTEEERKIKV